MKLKLLLILLCFTAFVGSCKSSDVKNLKYKDQEPVIYGMIYDYNNRPVVDAFVFVDDEFIVKSDVQGRFILSLSLKRKSSSSIRIEKETYETVVTTFSFDPMNVLYFRIPDAQQLLSLAEDSVEKHLYAEAEEYLERSLKLAPYRADVIYLQCIVFYKQNRIAETRQKLSELLEKDSSNIYYLNFLKKLSE